MEVCTKAVGYYIRYFAGKAKRMKFLEKNKKKNKEKKGKIALEKTEL